MDLNQLKKRKYIHAISQGYSVLFTTVNQMLDELYMVRADNSPEAKSAAYRHKGDIQRQRA